MPMKIEWENAKRFLASLPVGREGLLCAVSGGMDSMCLLHFAHNWGIHHGVHVTAAHFNHQLRGEDADRDEAFVRDWCARQNIPAIFGWGDTRAYAEEKSLSVEEAARALRYAFLEDAVEVGGYGCILTAHHADDNAETVLFNLIRGTGLRGLAGIPDRRGSIARPFLELTRAELADYAAEHEIPHVEDVTNAQDDAARNMLRHHVMPVLESLNPQASLHMSRTAKGLRQDDEALRGMAEDLLALADIRPGVSGSLPAFLWEECPDAVLRRALMILVGLVAGEEKDLTAAHIDAMTALCRGTELRQTDLPYGLIARRGLEGLFLEQRAADPEALLLHPGKTVAFGEWEVRLETFDVPNLSLPEGAEVSITTWRHDDRMTLAGANGSRSFKRLCVDYAIQPWQRDALPVLRINGRAAAAPGIGTDQAFAPDVHPCPARITFARNGKEETNEQ